MEGRVQECGCIAIPEALQKQTGLYPGATFEIEAVEDGAAILLRTIEKGKPSDTAQGAHCG